MEKKTINNCDILTDDKTNVEWISLNELQRIVNGVNAPVLYGGYELGYILDKDGGIAEL